MTRFSETEESKQRVREASDLVELAGRYTELRRAGCDRVVGLCPLHDERTPSFTISPAKQLFKCFGCDAGGDVFSLMQLKEGLDFPAALEFLARRVGIELEREDEDPQATARRVRRARAIALLERAPEFYAAHLRSVRSAEAENVAEYLASRGLEQPIRDQFMIGFAPDDDTALLRAARAAGFSANEMRDIGLEIRSRRDHTLHDRFAGRLVFPVCDVRGHVVGFGARTIDEGRSPKYVNSPTNRLYRKADLLYGAHLARAVAAKAGVVIVVEGYIDALAMHQAGFANTVALMGTAVNERQVAMLKRLAPTAVLILDGDEAGREATLRTGALVRSAGLSLLVAPVREGFDPAAVAQRHGPDTLGDLVRGARAFARYRVQHHIDLADLSTAEGKDRLVGELKDVFTDIPSSAVREDLIATIAEHLSLPCALVSSWMGPPHSANARDQSPVRIRRWGTL